MENFPALSNDSEGFFHLFCSKWCRDRFPYTLDRAHHETYKPRDENHMLCSNCMTPLKVTHVVARFISPGGNEDEAEVVNPGNTDETPYIFWVEDCFSPPMFAIEERGDSSAYEEFVSNDRTAHMVAIDPADYGDYGEHFSVGDVIGGETIEQDGWINLNGEFFAEDPGLPEPGYGPSGELYDGDNIDMWGPDQISNVRYFGVYEDRPLPEKGIRPENFSRWLAHQEGR
jgi:hypothetical protein